MERRAWWVVAALPLLLAGLTGCGGVGEKQIAWSGLRAEEMVLVLPLKDYPGSPEGKESGLLCQRILADSLNLHTRARVETWKPAGYDPRRGFTAEDAARLARERTAQYAFCGDCTMYHNAPSVSFDLTRAGMSLQLVRATDGQVVYAMSSTSSKMPFRDPERCIRSLATKVAKEVSGR